MQETSLVIVEEESRDLAAPHFYALADIPPEIEWLGNEKSKQTRRAYMNDVLDFLEFFNLAIRDDTSKRRIKDVTVLRQVKRAHIINWRDYLEKELKLAPFTVRDKLSALSSLFNYLCEQNAVLLNPVLGVKRPTANNNVGLTPNIGESRARELLDMPSEDPLQGTRDRAILATLLYAGLRRSELCKLRVKDMQERDGIMQLFVQGKGDKFHFVVLHPIAEALINSYLASAGHKKELDGAIFRPLKNNCGKEKGNLAKHLTSQAIYNIVKHYCAEMGMTNLELIAPHALRKTAATTALNHDADIVKVQSMLGNANISTTRLYDGREDKPEESPVFRINY